jgi:hypothetical protein
MAGSAHGLNASNPAGLPIPKIGLSNEVSSISLQTNNGASNLNLFHYPIVTAQDLTTKQIKDGVYVEMVVYRRSGKHRVAGLSKKQTSGYVAPSAWIAGSSPLNNEWTRSGKHKDVSGNDLPFDRPNHYKVTNQNQTLPVYEYLQNRHIIDNCFYRVSNSGGAIQNLKNVALVQSKKRSVCINPGSTFMYSSQYTPYYFAFRYIMWDKKSRQYVSGPLSRVIKLTHKEHPFIVDPVDSQLVGKQTGIVNPNFVNTDLICHTETRLP